VRSVCACPATPSALCWVPFTIPGGKPVTAVPGLTPRSPEIVEEPVLVTVELANTAKDFAVPKTTGACAAEAEGNPPITPKVTIAAVVPRATTPASPARRAPALPPNPASRLIAHPTVRKALPKILARW
jgi:hypothetical protein